MLVLREFYDVIRQVPELKVWNSVAAEIFQQLTAVRHILHSTSITAHAHTQFYHAISVQLSYYLCPCLQCFDTVGWVAGRASSL